jgi:FKBP-type peptidyl-prolyl cis-trans isomerase (trigger factor)
MPESKLYTNVSINRNERSEVVITADIPTEIIATYRPRTIKRLSENTELPGFRKGHIPEKLLIERMGEYKILEESARSALSDIYQSLITQEKLSVIGQPHVTITKLAPGSPVSFKIEAALMPEITLPDYKTLAKEVLSKKIDEDVTDEDVKRVFTELQTNKWRIDNKERADKGEQPKKEDLPEITDELVKTLGNFKDVADFKVQLTENLKQEKKRKAHEKKRVEIGEAIIEKADIPLPVMLVEHELNSMRAQLTHDLERAGITFENYLESIKKTEEDIRNEWRPAAEKRAKLQLVLNEIAVREHIRPDTTAVEKESKHMQEHLQNVDPERVRTYVETVLTNESVFQFLEGQK